MIETEIKELTEALKALNNTIANIKSNLQLVNEPSSCCKQKPEPEKQPEPVKESPPEKQPEPEKQSQVTEAELTELCLKIVRADRSKRDQIKETIKSFGGELLKDIDPSKYAELKSTLEVI